MVATFVLFSLLPPLTFFCFKLFNFSKYPLYSFFLLSINSLTVLIVFFLSEIVLKISNDSSSVGICANFNVSFPETFFSISLNISLIYVSYVL